MDNCQVAWFKLEYGQICASFLSKSVQKKEENIAIIGNLDFDVKQCLRVYEWPRLCEPVISLWSQYNHTMSHNSSIESPLIPHSEELQLQRGFYKQQ